MRNAPNLTHRTGYGRIPDPAEFAPDEECEHGEIVGDCHACEHGSLIDADWAGRDRFAGLGLAPMQSAP